MTMSISWAPASTASRVSARRSAREARPEGKAVDTAATLISVPATAASAAGTRSLYTHTAAGCGQEGSEGSGVRALATRERTFPGVSAPCGVVGSLLAMLIRGAQACEGVLIARVDNIAGRRDAT